MREKLIELLYEFHLNTNGHICDGCGSLYAEKVCADVADHLIANGLTFTPAVPGHDNKYNIAEMAYNNGYEKGFEDGQNKSVKRGRWIIRSTGKGKYANNWAECSECRVCGSPQWKVCPVCETRMENHSAINIEEVTEVDFDYAAEVE